MKKKRNKGVIEGNERIKKNEGAGGGWGWGRGVGRTKVKWEMEVWPCSAIYF